ncbi:hypothetical protein O0I10_012103 [Lichtheimia ornata]|uniref:Uncharacterized protein n=1 Tax=Lichtheimia ornata TaxID=688661 RepID=A0AAD7UTC1_9FUNG|nr:uncharacterized protein O0I10_012103 [Lichtheimia ornata]KAJ8652247.1 hypothetical protein O0I10_012103 [Lichtheimia ornata]
MEMWGVSAPTGSAERIRQYTSLIRHDYPDLFASESCINNRAAFRGWFMYDMNDNISILQSFLRNVQHETTIVVADLPPGLIQYLLRACPRPADWPEDDDSWVAVKELRDIAMEGARQRFVDRNGAPAGVAQDPEVSRRLRNTYLESIGNVPYNRFDMCELHVGSSKARFRNLGTTVYFDFDPTITPHGLVFKNEDRHLLPSARIPTIVYDYTPFWHAKNSYFPVFLDTLL